MREIKVAKPSFPQKEQLLKNIAHILDTGRLMNGEFTRAFEEKISEGLKVKHAISVNSCTTALEIVLRHIDVTDGEVILPTNTFLATPNAVLFAGGKPILADIKEKTYFLDPEEVRKLISDKTKAVIVVHIAGLVPPEIEEIKDICDKRGIPLVEDCAQAIGASYKGKMAGTFGQAGCFSFYPTKIITTGTGGMIVTGDADLDKYARSVRIHGAGDGLADMINIGNDWFLDEIRSCIGVNQMENLDSFLEQRRRIASYYDSMLLSTDLIEKFPVSELSTHAYYKYPVQVLAEIDVDEMKRIFPGKYGFELETIYWPTCHLQPVYKKKFQFTSGMFTVAETTMSKQITLPIYADITEDEVCYSFECVVSEIRSRLEIR